MLIKKIGVKVKLVLITGAHAVGKMTVGQQLSSMLGYKLLHNHMTIEFVNNFFHPFETQEGKRLNSLIKSALIDEILKSDLPGLVFTCMVAFDVPSSYQNMLSIVNKFEKNNAEIYVVELYADFNVRIERNKTENRLINKPLKRDIQKSEDLFRDIEKNHRLTSMSGEMNFKNYIRIDNTDLSPDEVAVIIKQKFLL